MKTPACLVTTWVMATLLLLSLLEVQAGQMFVADAQHGVVGEYSDTGEPIKPFLIQGLIEPEGIAVDGDGYLYVADAQSIKKFTVTGRPVSMNLAFGVCDPWAVVPDGKGNLFVLNYCGSVGEYTTRGQSVNESLITGLPQLTGLALGGTNLFISIYGVPPDWIGGIAEFTTSGATVNTNLVGPMQWNWGLVADGNGNVFVANNYYGTVTEYSASGTNINSFPANDGTTVLAFKENGNLLAASDFGGVSEFAASGTPVTASLIPGMRYCRGLALAYPPGPAVLTSGETNVAKGGSVSFSVTCDGTQPLKYRWFHNNQMIHGATNSSLELSNLSRSQSGNYMVKIRNAFGRVVSQSVRLTVTAPAPANER